MTTFDDLFTLQENEEKVWSKTISGTADTFDAILSLMVGFAGVISLILFPPVGVILIFLGILGVAYSFSTNEKQTYYITTNRIIKTDKNENQITEINIQDIVSVQTPLYHSKGAIVIHTKGTNEEIVLEQIKNYHEVRNTIQNLSN